MPQERQDRRPLTATATPIADELLAGKLQTLSGSDVLSLIRFAAAKVSAAAALGSPAAQADVDRLISAYLDDLEARVGGSERLGHDDRSVDERLTETLRAIEDDTLRVSEAAKSAADKAVPPGTFLRFSSARRHLPGLK